MSQGSFRVESGKLVTTKGFPYVIAELGSNHNGDMELARRLISEAKKAGADCVKFQSWSKDTIFSKKTYQDNFFISDDYRQRTDHTLESIVEAYSISEAQLIEMKEFCEKVEIDFASTPFSWREADFLVDTLKAPFIKVASMDVNNYPFLEHIGKKGLPVLISTGLSELYEFDKAIRTLERAGNEQIVPLHCISVYPPKDCDVNLRNIQTLQAMYPNYPIGFSDHSLGTAIPIASVAVGACVVEKHFTLDKEMEGWDHKVSASPQEMKELVEGARRVYAALGTGRIRVVEAPERVQSFRRSIVSCRLIRRGEIIQREDLDFKRPAEGMAPGDLEFVVGREAREDIPADFPIRRENLR